MTKGLSDLQQLVITGIKNLGEYCACFIKQIAKYINLHRYGCRKGAATIPTAEVLESQLPSGIVGFKQLSIKSQKCQWCGAFKFPSDQKGQCCNSGKVSINLREPPTELQELIMHDKDFRQNIRHYNNALAFASLSYKMHRNTMRVASYFHFF